MITQTTISLRTYAAAGRMLLLLIALLTTSAAIAVEPRLIPFQARLTDNNGTDLTGVFQITFVIYDAPTGGTALWSEVHPSASIIDGRLNVLLGSLADLDDPNGDGDPADAVQFDQARFVGIKVGSVNNQEMVPRHQLIPAFHARNADKLDGYDSTHLVPSKAIMMWSGSSNEIPSGWALCDGTNNTPNLSDRFILGVTAGENPGAFGGSHNISLSVANLPPHTHAINGGTGLASNDHSHSGTTSNSGGHTHGVPNNWHLTPNAPDYSPNEWGGTPPNGIDQWVPTSSAGEHSHTLATGGFSQNHAHQISFTSGSSGSGSPVDNRPAFYKLAFIMKL